MRYRDPDTGKFISEAEYREIIDDKEPEADDLFEDWENLEDWESFDEDEVY